MKRREKVRSKEGENQGHIQRDGRITIRGGDLILNRKDTVEEAKVEKRMWRKRAIGKNTTKRRDRGVGKDQKREEGQNQDRNQQENRNIEVKDCTATEWRKDESE